MISQAERGLLVGALRDGGAPSGGIGAVPATCTRSPTTTARENPATPSYGEWPVIELPLHGGT